MDNAERNAKSLAPERADPEQNVSPDQIGPDQNANHVSSLHPCQDPCAMENCIFPAVPEPGGSAGAQNGPEPIARNGRKHGPVKNEYIQNGTQSGTDRDQTGPYIPAFSDQKDDDPHMKQNESQV